MISVTKCFNSSTVLSGLQTVEEGPCKGKKPQRNRTIENDVGDISWSVIVFCLENENI